MIKNGMDYTIKFFLFLILFCNVVFAFDYDVKDNSLILKIRIDKTLELVDIKKEKLSLDCIFTGGKGEIFNRDFVGLPVAHVKSFYENSYYHIYIEFVRDRSDVKFDKQNAVLIVKIPFNEVEQKAGGVANPYLRIIFALIVILLLIFLLFIFLRFIYKKKITSAIPGVGRVIGKMDVAPGISILFVEVGSFLYLLSLSNGELSLIDKIDDEDEILKLKTGFSKFQDFSSYLRFFGKNLTKDEIEVTKTVVKEKVESLRKK